MIKQDIIKGSNAIIVDSAQNVIIGTTSASDKLHVKVAGTENTTVARFEALNNNRGYQVGTAADGAVNDAFVTHNAMQAGFGGHIWQVGGTEIARFDLSTTSGDTRFLIYDVDNGTVERVTVGAADSGGSGFKVLRIPN